MTVEELIALLQKFPPYYRVRASYDNGCGAYVDIDEMWVAPGAVIHISASQDGPYECKKNMGTMVSDYIKAREAK